MSDRLIILTMFAGAWLLGSWGTYAVIKILSKHRNQPAARRSPQ